MHKLNRGKITANFLSNVLKNYNSNHALPKKHKQNNCSFVFLKYFLLPFLHVCKIRGSIWSNICKKQTSKMFDTRCCEIQFENKFLPHDGGNMVGEKQCFKVLGIRIENGGN